MSESYSVRAILSAQDRGFSSTIKGAVSATKALGNELKSGLAFGVFAGIGQKAFDTAINGARDLIGEIDTSNAAWKTFNSNMSMFGKNSDEINKVKSELQSFAQDTIYSSSDMASTFAQLEAVGTKNTLSLVKGFGGLAAAAENPTQAMKTLSMQATQMAAKPKVAWEDFKLILEQTPAGVAAVAKEMGMSTQEMVTAVQDGKIKTEDFFNAISKVGTNKAFTKLATEAKTTGQAMDGLKETLGNKLTPAFEILSSKAIKGIDGITNKIAKIDGEKLATKFSDGVKAAQPYWEAFMKVASATGKIIKQVAGFFAEHADAISAALPYLLAAVAAYKGFKFVSSVAPGMVAFTKSITSLASGGIKGLAGKLFKVSGGMDAAGKSGATSSKQMLAAAKSFMMVGAGVLMVAGGFALLAYSAIALANAGGFAIGVMAGMALAVVGLTIGIMAMMKQIQASPAKLNAMAKAMLAVGVAVLLISTGFAIMAVSAIALANAGGLAIGVFVGMAVAIGALVAVFATFATQLSVGTMGFLALGAALLIAAVAMGILSLSAIALANAGTPAIVAMILMTAAIAALVAVFAIFAPVLTAGAVGVMAFGIAMLLTGTAALLASAALAIVAAVLPTICDYGLQGALAITALGLAMIIFGAGAAVAGVACVALGAGILVLAAGTLVLGAAILVAAAGIIAFGAGALVAVAGTTALTAILIAMTAALTLSGAGALLAVAGFVALTAGCVALGAGAVVATAAFIALTAGSIACTVAIAAFGVAMLVSCAGVLAMAAALKLVKSSMKSIQSSAKQTEKSLKSMQKSVKTVESGLNALGSKAKSAMKAITSAFDNTASKAQSSGQKVGTGFTQGMQSGLATAPVIAMSIITSVTVSLRSGYSGAYSTGAYISKGFADGMLSCLGTIRSAASQMVAAADKAVRAKAMIHSPSKLFKKNGIYMGEGQENGILSKVKDVWNAAKKMVQIPSAEMPQMTLAYAGGMLDEYECTRNNVYTIIVPVEVDGKEIAKVTAPYTQEELNKLEKRNNRKRGFR